MFIPFVAQRYLFSKKKHNTINVITWVSVAGVAVGTMALICVLSVLNGFENMVISSFSHFDPELKILPASGKSFDTDAPEIVAAKAEKLHRAWCDVIEQDALLSYDSYQTSARIKGVDSEYLNIVEFEKITWNGSVDFSQPEEDYAAIGYGLSYKLNTGVDLINPITLYAPNGNRVNLARPDASFNQLPFYSASLFAVGQAAYDDNYALLPISTVRAAYQLPETYATSIELRVNPRSDEGNKKTIKNTKASLKEILGEDYLVLDRYEQQTDFFRIAKIEKWTTFMILGFILMIATFNIIGSLSMLLIEKREDISLFQSLGARITQIKRLFIFEGFCISALGASIGTILGVAIVQAQAYFGIIKMGAGFIVEAYPVELQYFDLLSVLSLVLIMGYLAALYTATTQLNSYKLEQKYEW